MTFGGVPPLSALRVISPAAQQIRSLSGRSVKTPQALPTGPEGKTGDPEEEANFALTVLIGMTLVGKIYEGLLCINESELKSTLDGIPFPEEVTKLRAEVSQLLSGKLFLRIRQQAFHYSEKQFDFSCLRDFLKDERRSFVRY